MPFITEPTKLVFMCILDLFKYANFMSCSFVQHRKGVGEGGLRNGVFYCQTLRNWLRVDGVFGSDTIKRTQHDTTLF